jgi:hypothetical protein
MIKITRLSLRAKRGNLLAVHNRYALALMHNEEIATSFLLAMTKFSYFKQLLKF